MSTRHLWFGARLCRHSTALWLQPRHQQVIFAAMNFSKGGRPPPDFKLYLTRTVPNKSNPKSKKTAAVSWPKCGFLLSFRRHFGRAIANFSNHSGGGEEADPPSAALPNEPSRGSIARGFPVTPGVESVARPPKAERLAPSGLPSMPVIEPETPVTRTESSEERHSEALSNPERTRSEAAEEHSIEASKTRDGTETKDAETSTKLPADAPTVPPAAYEGEISYDLRTEMEQSLKEEITVEKSPRKEFPHSTGARVNAEPTKTSSLPPSIPSTVSSEASKGAPRPGPASTASKVSPTGSTPAGGSGVAEGKPPKGTRAYTTPPKKPTGPYGPPMPQPKGPLFPPKRATPPEKPATKPEPPQCKPAPKKPTGKDASPPASAAAPAAPKKEEKAAGPLQPPSKPPPTGSPGKSPGEGPPKKPTNIAPTGGTGGDKGGSKKSAGNGGSGKSVGSGGTKTPPPPTGKGSKGPRLITLMPGDGIGPEISMAVLEVLDAVKAPLIFEPVDVTPVINSKGQTTIPDAVIESMNRTKVGLKGPLMTPVGTGFRSLNLTLRQLFNLYANVRPCKSLPGVETVYGDVDVVTIRENTEGEYSGLEHTLVNGVVQSIKLITRDASLRVAEYCFKYALDMKRKQITAVHEVNNMRMSDGLFIRCMRETAKKYEKELKAGGIKYEEVTLKTVCLKIVEDPKRFDVLILPNLYGDIISDTCAGLIGGLGLTPSGNIGTAGAIFESVHGTAPDIAGKDLANPTALLLSTVMLLHYVELHSHADAIEKAIVKTIKEDNVRTIDLGGKAKCSEYTKALIKNLQ
ncbi:nascent polypeptide-associated complex subunit alpha, muscle-specific form [Drosophila subobscura]|uniref:nascent polypeptide-associated complex subunit alpha, muscle-specific form n=1 Tax=Drosophila subobscura TaxID=7241 RepID=UPI00155ABE3F|nr:nascent polypeptide-associated complex subunit alpha, muscle-specific form [Drosophila subobscura]